jgi:hypothetical protein
MSARTRVSWLLLKAGEGGGHGGLPGNLNNGSETATMIEIDNRGATGTKGT